MRYLLFKEVYCERQDEASLRLVRLLQPYRIRRNQLQIRISFALFKQIDTTLLDLQLIYLRIKCLIIIHGRVAVAGVEHHVPLENGLDGHDLLEVWQLLHELDVDHRVLQSAFDVEALTFIQAIVQLIVLNCKFNVLVRGVLPRVSQLHIVKVVHAE